MLGFHDEKGSAVSKQVLLAELEHLSPKEVVVKVAQPPAVQTEGAVELRLVGLCSILPICQYYWAWLRFGSPPHIFLSESEEKKTGGEMKV